MKLESLIRLYIFQIRVKYLKVLRDSVLNVARKRIGISVSSGFKSDWEVKVIHSEVGETIQRSRECRRLVR